MHSAHPMTEEKSAGGDAGETFSGGIPQEVAVVRSGEHLPWDRLAEHLVPILGVEGSPTVRQFPNGSANLTYLLAFGDRRFVVRRPPFGLVAPGAHDMKREYKVLSRLWQRYPRAPRAFYFTDDHSVVGSDFLVSEYRSGVVVWAQIPPELDAPGAARAIGFATVDALADLHTVDASACGLEDLGKPQGFLERQVRGWRERWAAVASAEHDSVMAEVGQTLHDLMPTSAHVSLVHNDFKIDNCQFRPGNPNRVYSVFDWDMATLADPLVDVGILLNYWPDPSDTSEDHSLHVPGLQTMGLPTRAEVVQRYATHTGFDLSHIGWYEAFAYWRGCVIAQQLYTRYVRGETTDARMKNRAVHVGMLSRRARRILQEMR